jgi:excinuclease UvrABC ATPase subunit
MSSIGKVTRFNPDTLAIAWRGKRIGDVLHREVNEAVSFFATCP